MMNNIINSQNSSLNFAEFDGKVSIEDHSSDPGPGNGIWPGPGIGILAKPKSGTYHDTGRLLAVYH